MTKEDQNAVIGAKVVELSESRKRLQCLKDKATQYADECNQIAWELKKAAGIDPGDRIPGLTLQARTFITKEEFDTLLRELEAEKSRFAGIAASLKEYGIS